MNSIKEKISKDASLMIGLGLIVLSMFVFLLPDLFHMGKMSESNFGIFILNYLISIVYLIIVAIREIPKFRLIHFHEKMEYGFIHLILSLISAFSLNREIPVFEISTDWLQVFLVFQAVVLLLVFIKDLFSRWLQIVFWGFLGIIFSFFLYYSVFLIPLYPVGIAATPAFGISLHAFVPLWFVLTILFYLLRQDNRKKGNIWGFCVGIVSCLIFVGVFLFQWNSANQIISKASDKSLMDEKNDLPEWTIIAQILPQNAISEKILKTGLVYTVASDKDHWDWFDMPTKSFDEIKKHDPLIVLATFVFGKPTITDDQKIKILEAMYDSRHKAQERLWSGDDLQTRHVLTNVRLYPNLRIGYTEKIITVRNTETRRTWRPEQEAIYTFHLPEGAVVTSLSLWINGKESPAVLTSKQKADTAYRTVVGVERHDPSLVRWQEGNTVSVRVFPCTPKEDRRFKIGITSPLRNEQGNLVYDNIWFDGPAPFNADETIKIKTLDEVDSMTVPNGFKNEISNTWMHEGKYQADWNLTFPIVPLKPNVFNFDNKSYSISEYNPIYKDFNPKDIYLDINNKWTKEEFDNIYNLLINKNLYIIQNQRIRVSKQNAASLFEMLTKTNFSVFPFYEITDPKNALVITKGTTNSPNISDLGECDFSQKLKTYIPNNEKIKIFNLGQECSPYIKTLKELRAFDYDCGSAADLVKIINDKKFITNQEDSASVVITDAGIKITETNDTTTKTNAPDHVMRLFAYNSVLCQTGTHYFEKDFLDSTIVDKAYKAYVVSPVTSLVVLETQADYKRFDIKDEGTSLKNASMKSSGAVPEPHEWLLIIILGGVAGYLIFKRKKTVCLK